MFLDNVFSQRRASIAGQVKNLIDVRGPRSAFQKEQLESLLKEADELERGINREQERKKAEAFRSWVRLGDRAPNLNLLREQRDMVAGTPTGGAYPGSTQGFEVPLDFRHEVESAMKYTGPMMTISDVIDTGNGRVYPMPSANDTAVSGEWLTEGQEVSLADVGGIGLTTLGSYICSSKMVRLSVSLLEDMGVPADAFLARLLGIRSGRAMEQMFTGGTGIGQPTGIMTAATQALIAQGANQNDGVSAGNSIGTSDVANLEAAVDPLYRADAMFMMHPNTLGALRAQRNKIGSEVFPDLAGGQADGQNRLNNYLIALNPSMDQLQTSSSSPQVQKNVLAFGSFKHFKIRRASPMMIRLSERFAEYRQVAFVLLWRVDSNLLDGDGGAVKYLSTVY